MAEERLATARTALQAAELAAEDLRARLDAADGRASELAAALETERRDAEARAASLRSAAGGELQRVSLELEAARAAEVEAAALSERLGRAAASANAAAVEAGRERDETRDELRAARDSCEALEGELREERRGGAALSERVAELTAELREAVAAGGKAAADAEEELQVCFAVFCLLFFNFLSRRLLLVDFVLVGG